MANHKYTTGMLGEPLLLMHHSIPVEIKRQLINRLLETSTQYRDVYVCDGTSSDSVYIGVAIDDVDDKVLRDTTVAGVNPVTDSLVLVVRTNTFRGGDVR